MLGFHFTASVSDEQVTSSTEEHTSECPYCSNLKCSCHTDVSYHSEVTEFDVETVDEGELSTALSFFGIGG